MEEENKNIWDIIKLPIVKNVAARTIAQDIKGYDPGNPQDVADWEEQQKKMWEGIKEKLEEKGIAMPEIVIDTTPGPITYGVKTVDEEGNTLHSLL